MFENHPLFNVFFSPAHYTAQCPLEQILVSVFEFSSVQQARNQVVHALPSYLVLAQRFIHKLFPSFLDFRPVGIPYVFFNIHILCSVFEASPQARAVND